MRVMTCHAWRINVIGSDYRGGVIAIGFAMLTLLAHPARVYAGSTTATVPNHELAGLSLVLDEPEKAVVKGLIETLAKIGLGVAGVSAPVATIVGLSVLYLLTPNIAEAPNNPDSE
jgi:hypothetical protein